MNIAMIQTPFFSRTGGERQLLMLSFELQRLGHRVEIFTNYANKSTYPELFSKLKVNIIPFDSKFPKAINGANAVSMMILLATKITKDFDIINNHNFPTEWAAFFAKKRLNIPVVWMCNEPPFWYLHQQQRQGLSMLKSPLYSIFDKLAVKQIDEILALSNLGAKAIATVYHRPSRVVRSGIDVDFFHRASGNAFRNRHNLENDFVLLQVGTLVYYKRQEDSIKALAVLAKKHGNVKLVLDGSGDPKPFIALAKKLGVQDKILFSHASTDEELAETYAGCDVFLFPSDNTWGLVVTEAMAASKPVIVSQNAGVAEIIQNNVTGFVVNHERPLEIADRLEFLINNPKLIDDFGHNCYVYVKEHLSWEKYAKDIEKIFSQTLEQNSEN